jgi:hypothetical protein
VQFTTETDEQLVCAVLAAQVALLRDRIDASATVELLWRTSDVLSKLSGLVVELVRRCPDSDAVMDEQCSTALATKAEINRSIDGLAFEQAQRNDFTCQAVDCVVTALGRLAATDAAIGTRLSPDGLAALYVSSDQREVHEAVIRKLSIDASQRQSVIEGRSRKRLSK